MELLSTFIGHKFRCFDVRFCTVKAQGGAGAGKAPPTQLLLTASEDGTAKLWNVDTCKCVFTFQHSKDCEVLRAAFLDDTGCKVITCGADGQAIIWVRKAAVANVATASTGPARSNPYRFEQACSLDHGDAQIYACEAVPRLPVTAAAGAGGPLSSSSVAAAAAAAAAATTTVSAGGSDAAAPTSNTKYVGESGSNYSALLTAADDRVYLWDLSSTGSALPRIWVFRNAASASNDLEGFESQVGKPVDGEDGDMEEGEDAAASRTYGGERNKEDAAYIFDAKICPVDPSKVAVALSDGTVRILDISNTKDPSAKRDTITALDVGGLVLQLGRRMKKAKRSTDDSPGGGGGNREDGAGVGTSSPGGSPSKEGDKDIVVHATCVSWMPGSSSSLAAALGDGSVLLLDLYGDGEYQARALLSGHEKGCFGVMCLSVGRGKLEVAASGGSSEGESDINAVAMITDNVEDSGSARSSKRKEAQRSNNSALGMGSARVVSWSSDGSLCEWDLENSTGIVTTPLNRLVVKDHPFYCCTASSSYMNQAGPDGSTSASPDSVLIACAGGAGGNGGFMGIPVHLARYTPSYEPQEFDQR